MIETSPANPFRSIPSHERIQLMDALRGFALFGILTVNIWSFSRYEWLPAEQRVDTWLTDLLTILVDTKFMTIFSILFGAGFSIQLQRASANGVNFIPYFSKRMLILFLIGCLHAYLFWFGDIVRNYALLGVALLAIRSFSAKATLRLALVFIGLLTPSVFILNEVIGIHTNPEQVDGIPLLTFIHTSFVQGSYPQILRANWIIDPWHNFIQDMPISLVAMFGRIVLGVWLARIGFFRNPAAHETLLKKWLWWGGTAGIAGSVAFWAIQKGLLPMDEPYMLGGIYVVASCLVLHSLFYIALFVKLYTGILGTGLLRFLAPVGRMGLTNYVGQTMLAFAIFYGTGTVGNAMPIPMLGWTVVIFTMQILISRWWLSRYEFGPIEWVWRRLAYMRTTARRLNPTVDN